MATSIPILGVQQKNYSRIKYDLGVYYYEDNLYFKNDISCHAIYNVGTYSYDFESTTKKKRLHNNLKKLFWGMTETFHFIDVPRETSIVEDNEHLKRYCKGPLKLEAYKEIDATTEDLIENIGDKGNEYDSYLIIKFKKPGTFFTSLMDFGKGIFTDPIRELNKYLGTDFPEIRKREYDFYRQQESILNHRVNNFIGVTRGTEYETERLIKYLFWFGIASPPMTGRKPLKGSKRKINKKTGHPKGDIVVHGGEEYIRPKERQLLRLTEGDLDIAHPRHITTTQMYKGQERKSYMSFLALADMPETTLPGGEWLFYLKQQINFPIYTSVRGVMVENRIAKAELGRKKLELDDQVEHIRDAQDVQVPQDVLEQMDDAAHMDRDIKVEKFPLIYTSYIIGVAADSKDELLKRIDTIKTILDPIPVEVPAGDQWLMFNEAMIGGEQYQKDYVMPLPPHQLALLTPGASIDIGDEEGFYMGITGALRKIVRIGPWIPSLINKPPNACFIGAQGGGKSFSADEITLKTCKYYGAKGLWIDPKGDRTYWPEKFTSFGDEIRVTSFTAEQTDRGKLDPFVVLVAAEPGTVEYSNQMEEAIILAIDIAMFFLGIDRKDPKISYLLEASRKMSQTKRPSMSAFMAAIAGKPEEMRKYFSEDMKSIADSYMESGNETAAHLCQGIYNHLDTYRGIAYAGLLFGEGGEQGIDFKKQINVLQIQNLTLPREGTDPIDYSFAETVGYGCLLGLAGYIMKFVMEDRKTLSIFMLDESKIFEMTPAGRAVKMKLHGMARAMNSPGYFIGQSPDHIGDETVWNAMAYKFCFRMEDETEIKKVLKLYKLEESEANKEMIANLETGYALFQDHQGRTAVVYIDYVFEEYREGLDTTPPPGIEVGGD